MYHFEEKMQCPGYAPPLPDEEYPQEPDNSPEAKRMRKDEDEEDDEEGEVDDEDDLYGESIKSGAESPSQSVDCESLGSIERLLEEGLDEHSFKSVDPSPVKKISLDQARVRQKTVLSNRVTDYFEVLPEGWIEITHQSGLPVYLHKASRVCVFSRPYFIGPGSARNHDVPLSSIPCLHQKKSKQWEAERSNAGEPRSSQEKVPFKVPEVRVQTIEDYKAHNVSPSELNEYAGKIFEFERINVVRFKTWGEHRAYLKQQKREKQLELMTDAIVTLDTESPNGEDYEQGDSTAGRPMVPANVKLITVPDLDKGSKPQRKQFLVNPQGKTSITILHEYVQKILKGTLTYDFTENGNSICPFTAHVKITCCKDAGKTVMAGDDKRPIPNDCIIGSGSGNSKRIAKQEAAKQALKVLMPSISISQDCESNENEDSQESVAELFDLIPLTDSRVPDLCIRTGQPTPFVILQECLKRNSGLGQMTIHLDLERVKHQQHAFCMSVGKHSVRVLCSNKKEGKQKASQAMLERLHPQVRTWGALIRLYGYCAMTRFQKIRKQREDIIKLQATEKSARGKVDSREPNRALLNKLKMEMEKLYDKQKAYAQPTKTHWWESTVADQCRASGSAMPASLDL